MRLLLIEDYRPLQKSLAKGLREAGFAVDTTGDGNEGLWYAASNDYDVIILDLMLPGMKGLTLLKTLRAKGRNSPVLILTAKDIFPSIIDNSPCFRYHVRARNNVP